MSQEPAPRRFTLEEANQTLEVIRPLVEQVMEIRQAILDHQPAVSPVLEKAAGNGGSRAASLLQVEFIRLEALLEQINTTGAIFRDINTGLVDFLSEREGREVYLCWKLGEDAILFWHELDAGAAGRQKI